MNAYVGGWAFTDANGNPAIPYWRKITRGAIPKPDLTAIFADTWANFIFGNASYYPISARHAGRSRANVVCVDGHVESCRWINSFWDTSAQDISFVTGANTDGGGKFKVHVPPCGNYAQPCP